MNKSESLHAKASCSHVFYDTTSICLFLLSMLSYTFLRVRGFSTAIPLAFSHGVFISERIPYWREKRSECMALKNNVLWHGRRVTHTLGRISSCSFFLSFIYSNGHQHHHSGEQFQSTSIGIVFPLSAFFSLLSLLSELRGRSRWTGLPSRGCGPRIQAASQGASRSIGIRTNQGGTWTLAWGPCWSCGRCRSSLGSTTH